MTSRYDAGNYPYAYQGQEKDNETGMEAFELRLWDARIGRWLTTDSAGQYHSPYLGMGNNPISRVDPDGGTDDWYFNSDTNALEWHAGSSADSASNLTWVGSDFAPIDYLRTMDALFGGDGNLGFANSIVYAQLSASEFANKTSRIASLVSQSVDATSFSAKQDLLTKGETLYGVYQFGESSYSSVLRVPAMTSGYLFKNVDEALTLVQLQTNVKIHTSKVKTIDVIYDGYLGLPRFARKVVYPFQKILITEQSTFRTFITPKLIDKIDAFYSNTNYLTEIARIFF